MYRAEDAEYSFHRAVLRRYLAGRSLPTLDVRARPWPRFRPRSTHPKSRRRPVAAEAPISSPHRRICPAASGSTSLHSPCRIAGPIGLAVLVRSSKVRSILRSKQSPRPRSVLAYRIPPAAWITFTSVDDSRLTSRWRGSSRFRRALGIGGIIAGDRPEWLAVQHDGVIAAGDDAAHRAAILGRGHRDGHFISGLERALRPSHFAHGRHVVGLHHPVLYFAFFVFRVDLQQAMRIGPEPFRHHALHRNRFGDVVGRISVMRKQGKGTDRDRKSTRLNSSHPSISYAVFCLKKKSNCNMRR